MTPVASATPSRRETSGRRAQESAIQLQLELGDNYRRTARTSDESDANVGRARRSSAAVSVDIFHHVFGLPRRSTPGLSGLPDSVLRLRVDLLREEIQEFEDAVAERDLVAIADALADIVYVTYGAAVTLGIDLDDVVAEVHRSNMTKLDANGAPLTSDGGKVLKPPSYSPPAVGRVLEDQPPLARPSRR